MSPTPKTLGEALSELEGTTLSSVEFLQDHLQLHFDGPNLTAYTPPSVSCGGGNLEWGHDGYRDALCQQIGRRIEGAKADDQSLSLMFEGGAAVSISLREEDYHGPEAIQFSISAERTWVV